MEKNKQTQHKQEYSIGLFNKEDYKPLSHNRSQLRNKIGNSFQIQVNPEKYNKLISNDQLQMYSSITSHNKTQSIPLNNNNNNIPTKKTLPSFTFKYSKEHKENVIRNILGDSKLLNITNQYHKDMALEDCKDIINNLDERIEYETKMKEEYKRKYLEKSKECQEIKIGNLIPRVLVKKAMKNKSVKQAIKVYEPKSKSFYKRTNVKYNNNNNKNKHSHKSTLNTLDDILQEKYSSLRKRAVIEMDKTLSKCNNDNKLSSISQTQTPAMYATIKNIDQASSLTTLNPSIKIPETIDSNLLNNNNNNRTSSIQGNNTKRSKSSTHSTTRKNKKSFNIEESVNAFPGVNKIQLIINLNHNIQNYPSVYRPAIQSYINSVVKNLHDNFDTISTDILNELIDEVLIDLQEIERVRDLQETKNSFIVYLKTSAKQNIKDTKKIELQVNTNVIQSETHRTIPYKSIDPCFIKPKQDEEVQTEFTYEDILKQNEFYCKPFNSIICNYMKCKTHLPYLTTVNKTLISTCEAYKQSVLEYKLLNGEFFQRNIFNIYDTLVKEICDEISTEQIDIAVNMLDEYFKAEYNKEINKTSS